MIPDALLQLATSDGEVLQGSLLTSGRHAFVDPHGQTHLAPIWCLMTDRRAWLGAAHASQTWAIAVGRPEDAEVQRGWTWDAVRVGTHSAPLRRGTRAAAEKLIETWRPDAEGETWSTPIPPEETERTTAAKGATGLPEWWVAKVPGSPDERWLFACETCSTQPFNNPDGTIAYAPIWVGVSDRRAVLAAQHPEHAPWSSLIREALHHEPRTTRDRLVADGRELEGAVLADPKMARVTALTHAPAGSPRWAEAIHQSILADQIKDAIRLIDQAFGADLADRSWTHIAQLLHAVERTDLAVASAARALHADPSVDTADPIRSWTAALSKLRKALRREKVDEAWLRGQLKERLEALTVAEPPPGAPWPPRHPSEVWAAALDQVDRAPEAVAVWVDMDRSPRQLQGLAAALERAALPKAASLWAEAALAHREAGDDEDASRALERAIALDGAELAPYWTRATWAWQDGDPETARSHWERALDLDPTGNSRNHRALDALGLHALAEHAGELGHWTAAASAWRSALAREPDDEHGWTTVASILERELEKPEDAIEIMRAHARHVDDDVITDPQRPRWSIHVDLARVLASTGDMSAALTALREALRGDFLTPAAFEAALACPALEAPEAATAWWRHLHRLHAGEGHADGNPLEPQQHFTDEALDALHLGGSGWLHRVRQSLDAPTPPSSTTLSRGLQTLAEDHPEAHALVERVSEALELTPPATYLFRGEGAWGVSGWPTEPPVLLVGAQHLRDGPRKLSEASLCFLIAVELAHLRCEHPVLSFDADIIGTSKSAYGVFGRYAGAAESVVDLVTLVPGVDQIAKLQKIIVISRRVFMTRSVIDKASSLAAPVLGWMGGEEESASSIGREGLAGAALQLRLQADRVALLVCGDARAGVDAILRSSSQSLELADRVQREGLHAILTDPETSLSPDEAIRLTSLLEFAAERTP